MAGGQIQWNMSFKVDKAGLNELKTELQSIQNLTTADYARGKHAQVGQLAQELKQIKQSAFEVQTALEKSFNVNLGTLNVTKFNQELHKLDIKQIAKDFYDLGATGQSAFRNVITQSLTTNLHLKETHKLLDSIATSMGNTIKWGLTSSVFNTMVGSLERAWNFSKQLDTSLNSIRIVTGKSADDMERFATQANKAAKDLGASTRDYTDAALIYYQQGLSDEEAAARTETTLKAANVTGQTGQEVSEQLTAVWNGYKVSAEETEAYVDRLAAVAANSASDLEELSTGISRVAFAANTAGVDIDQLTAQVATIVSVTREAPETVGNSLKTMFARFGDLKVDGVDEFGVTLGKVSGQLEAVGVQVLDESGNMREMGDIIEDLATKWDTWTSGQKQAVAVAVAGKMQYSRLMTLMENWDMYRENLETSQNAMGTLQEQQDIYMESTEAHLQQLSTAWEHTWMAMSDSDSTRSVIDVLTGLVEGMGNFVESIGGGGNALLTLGSISTQVFSKYIARSIATTITNINNAKENVKTLSAEMQLLEQFKGIPVLNSVSQELIQMKEKMIELNDVLSAEDRDQLNNAIKQRNELENQLDTWTKEQAQAQEFYKRQFDDTLNFNALEQNKDIEKQYINQLNDLMSSYKEADKLSANFSKSIVNLNNALIDNAQYEGESEEATNKVTQANIEVESQMNDYIDAIHTLSEEGRLTTTQLQQLQDAEVKFQQALRNADDIQNPFESIDVQNAAKNLVQIVTKTKNEIVSQVEQTSSTVTKGFHGTTTKIINDIDTIRQEYDAKINSMKTVQVANQIVEMVGAIGSLASAMQAIGNLSNIWDNDDLTTGEKIIQTIMSLSTAFGMASNGIKSFCKDIVVLNAIIKSHSSTAKADAAATGMQNAATEANTIAVNKNRLAFLKHPIGLILVAITALVGGIIALTNHLKNNTKATIENNQANIEAEQEKQALIDKNQELFDSLSKTTDEMKNNSGSIDELNEVIKSITDNYDDFVKSIDGVVTSNGQLRNSNGEIIEGLDLTSIKANVAAKNYDALAESAKKAQKAMAEAEIRSAKSERASAESTFDLQTREGLGNFVTDSGYVLHIGAGASKEDDRQAEEILKRNLDIASYNIDWGDITLSNPSIEARIELFKELQNFVDEYEKEVTDATKRNESEIYKNIKQILAENSDVLKVIFESNIKIQEATEEENKIKEIDRYNAGDFEGKSYEEIQQEVINDLKATGDFVEVKEEEFKDIANEQLSGISDELDALQKEYLLIQDILKDSNFSDLGYWATNKLKEFGSENPEALENLQKVLSSSIISDEQKRELRDLAYNNHMDELVTALQGMVRQVELASVTISATTEKYSQLEEIRKKVESDTALEQEDYAALSIEMQKFFSLMADGTYQMTGNAEEFYQLITEQQRQGFRDILEKNKGDFSERARTENRQAKSGLAATATSTDDLAALLNNREIATRDYKSNYDRIRESQLEDVDLDPEVVSAYAEQIENTNENIKNLKESLENTTGVSREIKDLNLHEYLDDIATTQMRLSRGAKTISDNWEDWSEALKDSSDPAYAEAIVDMKDAVADLTNSSADYISNDTITEHLDDIYAAAQGDTDALLELQQAVSKDYLVSIGVDVNKDEINNILTDVDNYLNSLAPGTIEVGAVLDDDEFINSLNSLIRATGMTSDQVAEYLGSMGMDADLTTTKDTVTSTMQVPSYTFKLEGMGLKAVPHLEPLEYTHEVEIPAIKTTAQGGSGVRVVSGGNFSKSSAESGFGKGSSGSGKSGSGGGGSTKEPDFMDAIEDELDRYHDIDIILKQIDTDLSRLEKQQDKLFGQDLINNLNEQLADLEKQVDATNQKIVIAQGEAAELRNKLSGSGVAFNADGTIANYQEAYESQLNYVNSLIDRYNSMSAEEQEAFKDTVEQAKENFDEFTNNIDRYDELITDTIPGLQDEIQEAIDKEIEINIQKFNAEVEIRLDMAEAEREWNEFKKKVIDQIKDTDILGNTRARLQDFYSYYNTDNTGEVQALTQHIQDTLNQLSQMDSTGWSEVYGDNRNQALEDLKSYNDELMSSLGDVEDLVDEIKESYIDMMDEAAEKFDDQIGLYEQVADIIDHNMNVIKMVYGEDSYSDLAKYYDKQEDNYNQMLDFQRQQKDFWYDQMKAIEAAGGKSSEAWLKAKENWMDAVSAWKSSIEDAIENLQDKYLNALNDIFDQMNKKVTSGKGLEYIEEEWDLINKKADQYLDTVNAIYGVQQLQDKYLDAIDDTDSVGAQRRLNQLMQEEIKMLQDKDKLTQYDLDRANLRYQIALQQIALEEAQQNKTSMRLRRDTQGNYTYQYVADDDAVDEAQDELSNLYNQLYNLDLNQYRDNLDQIYTLWNEYQQKMYEAAQITDPEERLQREQLLRKEYGELINGLVQQNEELRTNMYESTFLELKDFYTQDTEIFNNNLGEKFQGLEDLIEQSKEQVRNALDETTTMFDQMVGANLQAFQNMDETIRDTIMNSLLPEWNSGCQEMAYNFGENGFEGVVRDAFLAMEQLAYNYQLDLDALQAAADEDFSKIRDGIDETIGETQALIDKNDELIGNYGRQLDAIGSVIDRLNDLIAQYDLAREAAINATKAAYDYEQAANSAAAAANALASAKARANAIAASGSNSSSSGSSSSGSKSGSGSGSGGSSSGSKSSSSSSNDLWSHYDFNNSANNYLKKNAYDTGGYTGDWTGNDGRIAMLHKKELVLNQDDTNNVLNMVRISRDLMNTAATQSIGSAVRSMVNITPTAADTSTIDQNVHIEASFPGVQTASEIEQALNNVVNIAAQRAMRRGR